MKIFTLTPYGGENRAIGIAFLVSIALHALLLFAFPSLRESQRQSSAREPLVARLIEPRIERAAAPPSAIAEKRTPVHAPAITPPPKARAAPKSAPLPPAPQIASAALDVPRVELAPASPAATIATAAPAAQVFAPGGASQPAAAHADALDAGTLAQYRLAIISAARRFKRYPSAALDNNWQGRVEIRMVIASGGDIAALSVRTSAGHPVLDQQALEMIERAKAMSPIPPALRGKEFTVDIPVIFSLLEPDT